MRVIHNAPPPPGPLQTLTAHPPGGEAYVIDWCRQIATKVAGALHTDATHTGYRLTLREDLPVPHLLHTAFTVDGHQVAVTVVWDDPRHEPGFALTVDGTAVPIDTRAPAAPAALLACAAWQAILSAPTHAGTR